MSLDTSTRGQAIPFFGQVAGYNRNDQSDIDITKADALGDLAYLANTGTPYVPHQYNLIRILRPQFCAVTSAYLTLSLTTASAESSPKFYLTAGTGFTTASGVVAAIPSLSQIVANHTLLKGNSSPWTTPNSLPGTITVSKLNILKQLPAMGDTNYRGDCFVVGIHFLQTPNNGAGFKLNKFEVNLAGVVAHG